MHRVFGFSVYKWQVFEHENEGMIKLDEVDTPVEGKQVSGVF
jgi:hypothetical protein